MITQVRPWSSQLWTPFEQMRREAWKIQDFNWVLDCEQSLRKSVERPAFLRKSCFVTQTNKKTEGAWEEERKKELHPLL